MGSFLADFKKGAYVAIFFSFSFLTRGDPIRICAERISEVHWGGGGVFIQYILASLYD